MLSVGTQKSQVLPGFFGTRRGEVWLTLREAEVLPAKRAKNEGNGAKISSVTLNLYMGSTISNYFPL